MSLAPGARELRWFALCTALAAAYFLANTVTNVPASEGVVLFGSRLAMCFAGFYSAAWLKCFSVTRGTGLGRIDRVGIVLGLGFAALSLVPDATMTAPLQERALPWLGATYRDAVPTPLGTASYAYHSSVTALLAVRYGSLWRRGARDAGAFCIAFATVLACDVNDTLAALTIFQGPYLLVLGLLGLVVVVGAKVTAQFVANARALEASSGSLEAAQRALVKRERLAALGELSAMVAHEVRNPLGVVYNALAGLRKGGVDAEQHAELVQIAQEEADRIRRIISDLLEFARPRPPVLEAASVEDVVTRAVEAARVVADAPASEIQVHVDSLIAPLLCDEQLVRQAVINLTSNALQAIKRRGPVHVFVSERDGFVAIRVVDDGEGITGEESDKIFTPFYSTRATGTGLGLAIVQRTARAHGGDVDLATTPGGGATFTITLARNRRPSGGPGA